MPGEEHYQFSKDTWVSQIEEDKVAGQIQDGGGERNGIKAGACCWGVEVEGEGLQIKQWLVFPLITSSKSKGSQRTRL